METIAFLALVVAWIWSVAIGIQVSVLCMICNFMFPPISQLIYSVYESKIRAPFFVMAACIGYFVFTGDIQFTYSS